MASSPRPTAAPRQPRTVLVPLLNLSVATELVHLAAALLAGRAGGPLPGAQVIVLGVVEVPASGPLDDGRPIARAYRALLSFLPNEVPLGDGVSIPVNRMVRVAYNVADGIRGASESAQADLLLLHWKGYASDPARHRYGGTLDDLLADPPADLVLARAGGWNVGGRIVVPVRGGPAAELALDMGLTLAPRLGATLTVMHSIPRSCPIDDPPDDPTTPIASRPSPAVARLRGDEPYLALAARLDGLDHDPRVALEHVLTASDDVGEAITGELRPSDLVILGAPGAGGGEDPALHPVVGRVLDPPGRAVLLVRARAALDLATYQHPTPTAPADDITAEQWFVENTYHADEFKKLKSWQELKQAHHARIGVVVPTLNDAARLRRLLMGLRDALDGKTALADAVVVIDSGSSDNTVALAHELGFPAQVLDESALSRFGGPTATLRAALAQLDADLLVWLDPKATHVSARLIPILTAPLLTDPDVRLVKPFWTALAPLGRTGGGSSFRARFARVTAAQLLALGGAELVALPMYAWFRAFFPALGALVEPVNRVFAARRPLLAAQVRAAIPLPPLSGIAYYAHLILETAACYGARAVAQVELDYHPPRRARPPSAGADLRILRQLADLVRLFRTRPEAQPHAVSLLQLEHHLAQFSGM